ncbi:MAG: NAD+ synthase [Chlamydiia bacterium]|nr:NAD+ synthase [Chlamydiia bacterium]
MRIWLAQINATIGDLEGNSKKILHHINLAKQRNAEFVLFSELALTGYPPQDFLHLPAFIAAAEKKLEEIAKQVKGIIAIIGTPRLTREKTAKPCYNSAAIIQEGKILGFQDKILLPTYDVFDESRYFEPGKQMRIWELQGQRVAITLCEDIWQHSGQVSYTSYARDPVTELLPLHPSIVFNLSASPYSVNKIDRRFQVCNKTAKTLQCPLVLCNQVGGNDSLIFDGHSFYLDKEGQLTHRATGFSEDHLEIDTDKQVKPLQIDSHPTEDLFQALVLGLRDYFQKSGFTQACFGLSGGIDSAIVACIAKEALGKENLLALNMPSRYSSEEGKTESQQLADRLGISYKEISIEAPFSAFLNLLEPHFENRPQDATEENLQARTRAIILMAISNKFGYVVLSTGNKSELAMGYSTLYGDMVGGLGVISDVTKVQVYQLAKWINRNEEIIPWNTINKPPSAELKPNQKDSDSLPPYEIIDTVLKDYVEEYLDPDTIAKKHHYPLPLVTDIIRRIHLNEYKRRQSPPGLRVTEKAFSIGRRFPIVQRWL